MKEKVVYFAIRDDDTCYFTRAEDLESCYGKVWDICPISLSVVPFHASTKSGAVPKQYWSGTEVFPLERNRELVEFLRDNIARGRIHITLHGYHHRGESDAPEFAAGKDLEHKVIKAKRYLEDLWRQPITVFVPPHNALGPAGYRAVVKAGMNIAGVPSFRLSLRGWDPRVLTIGLKRRLSICLSGFPPAWPIVFPDGHREVWCCGLAPHISLEDLKQVFDRVSGAGGVFVLATHYWEFDVLRSGQEQSIRQVFSSFWDYVNSANVQIKFLTLAEICEVDRS